MIDGIRYVRAVRRHARLVVATALVAVVLTVLMLFFLPQRYRATADVVVILPDVQTGSLIATTAQAVSDFEGALRTKAVARAAAEASGLPAGSISDGLRTEWLEGGTVVEVTFIGPDPGSTETAVFTASKAAIGFLLDARLAPIAHRLDNAQQAMADAVEGLDEFTIEHELLDVDKYVKDQNDRLQGLRSDRDQALVDGDEAEAEQLQDRIDSLLQETASIRSEFATLQSAREQAFTSLGEARSAHDTALGAVEAAEDASTIKVLAAEAVPRTERLPSQLLVVVVVATALTIGLIVLLELLTPRQRASASSSDRRDRAPAGPSLAAVERRRAGPAPPTPVGTSPGGASGRGIAGGRAPTGDGNSSPSASRAAPFVDASTRERRPVAPTPGRTSPPTEGASRRAAEVREDTAPQPRSSRPDRPVMGGAAPTPPVPAPRPEPVGTKAPEATGRASVGTSEGRPTSSGGGGTASQPRSEARSDRSDPAGVAAGTKTATAPAGPKATLAATALDGPNAAPSATSPDTPKATQAATAPDEAKATQATTPPDGPKPTQAAPSADRPRTANRSKKRKKRNRRPAAPGTQPTSSGSTSSTAPAPATGSEIETPGTGEAAAVSAPEPASTDGSTATAPIPAATGRDEDGAASTERTDGSAAASNDGDSSGDEGQAPRSEDPSPSRNA